MDRAYTRFGNRCQRLEKLLSAYRVARLTAEGPSPEPSDGSCPKRLGLVAGLFKELFSSVTLISQQNARTRRLGQSAGDGLISSVSGQEYCRDYDLGRLMNERMDLESVKPVS
jgi:hypothetical protein